MHDPTLPSINGCYVYGDLGTPGCVWSTSPSRRHRRRSPSVRRSTACRASDSTPAAISTPPTLPAVTSSGSSPTATPRPTRDAPRRQRLLRRRPVRHRSAPRSTRPLRRSTGPHPRRRAHVYPRDLDRGDIVHRRVAARRDASCGRRDLPARRRGCRPPALLSRHGNQRRGKHTRAELGGPRQPGTVKAVGAQGHARRISGRDVRAQRPANARPGRDRELPAQRDRDRPFHRAACPTRAQGQRPLPARQPR